MVKNPPAMQETWVWPPGWQDPLKEGMATHSSILAWKIPRTEESGRLPSMGSKRVGHDWVTKHHTSVLYENIQNGQRHRNRKQVSGFQGLGEGKMDMTIYWIPGLLLGWWRCSRREVIITQCCEYFNTYCHSKFRVMSISSQFKKTYVSL